MGGDRAGLRTRHQHRRQRHTDRDQNKSDSLHV